MEILLFISVARTVFVDLTTAGFGNVNPLQRKRIFFQNFCSTCKAKFPVKLRQINCKKSDLFVIFREDEEKRNPTAAAVGRRR